jgi:hypothetical protein
MQYRAIALVAALVLGIVGLATFAALGGRVPGSN